MHTNHVNALSHWITYLTFNITWEFFPLMIVVLVVVVVVCVVITVLNFVIIHFYYWQPAFSDSSFLNAVFFVFYLLLWKLLLMWENNMDDDEENICIVLYLFFVKTLSFAGSGVFVLIMTFVQRNYVASLICSSMAITFCAFHRSGVVVNVQDIAPKYAGSVFG